MADLQLLALLRAGSVARFNAWRQAHPNERVDLRAGALDGLTHGELAGADLRGDVHCSGADFSGSALSGVLWDKHTVFAGAAFDNASMTTDQWLSLAEYAFNIKLKKNDA